MSDDLLPTRIHTAYERGLAIQRDLLDLINSLRSTWSAETAFALGLTAANLGRAISSLGQSARDSASSEPPG